MSRAGPIARKVGRTGWVPGAKRDRKAHGWNWSQEDRQLAIDAVVALVMEGLGVEGACNRVCVSARTFEKWRENDPELNETITSIVALRPGRIGRDPKTGRWQRNPSLTPIPNKIKEKGEEIAELQGVKSAWLYYYSLTKDRVYSCKVADVSAQQVIKWYKEDENFAAELDELEIQKQWMVEDILWRRGVVFKDASALRVLLADSKVGKKKANRQPERNLGIPTEVHFHVSPEASERVAERLGGILDVGSGEAKQLPDSTEPVGLHSSGRSSGGNGSAGPDGNGEGALHQ